MSCAHDPYETTKPFTHMTVLLIGVTMGFFGFALLLHFDPRPALYIDCTRSGCHRTPPLNTGKKYATFHKKYPKFRPSLNPTHLTLVEELR